MKYPIPTSSSADALKPGHPPAGEKSSTTASTNRTYAQLGTYAQMGQASSNRPAYAQSGPEIARSGSTNNRTYAPSGPAISLNRSTSTSNRTYAQGGDYIQSGPERSRSGSTNNRTHAPSGPAISQNRSTSTSNRTYAQGSDYVQSGPERSRSASTNNRTHAPSWPAISQNRLTSISNCTHAQGGDYVQSGPERSRTAPTNNHTYAQSHLANSNKSGSAGIGAASSSASSCKYAHAAKSPANAACSLQLDSHQLIPRASFKRTKVSNSVPTSGHSWSAASHIVASSPNVAQSHFSDANGVSDKGAVPSGNRVSPVTPLPPFLPGSTGQSQQESQEQAHPRKRKWVELPDQPRIPEKSLRDTIASVTAILKDLCAGPASITEHRRTITAGADFLVHLCVSSDTAISLIETALTEAGQLNTENIQDAITYHASILFALGRGGGAPSGYLTSLKRLSEAAAAVLVSTQSLVIDCSDNPTKSDTPQTNTQFHDQGDMHHDDKHHHDYQDDDIHCHLVDSDQDDISIPCNYKDDDEVDGGRCKPLGWNVPIPRKATKPADSTSPPWTGNSHPVSKRGRTSDNAFASRNTRESNVETAESFLESGVLVTTPWTKPTTVATESAPQPGPPRVSGATVVALLGRSNSIVPTPKNAPIQSVTPPGTAITVKFADVSTKDVIFGFQGTLQWEGNRHYQSLKGEKIQEFSEAPYTRQRNIVLDIINQIRSDGGRFLRILRVKQMTSHSPPTTANSNNCGIKRATRGDGECAVMADPDCIHLVKQSMTKKIERCRNKYSRVNLGQQAPPH